ncbi:hypothetical protein Ddye_013201, partial [Dipteronia dyeriana]
MKFVVVVFSVTLPLQFLPIDQRWSKVIAQGLILLWDNLVKNFNKTTGKEYNKVQLKSRWDALKSDWKLWRDLAGKEIDLGWNAKLKTIDVSEEWWHRKLQVHHNATKIRKEGIDPTMMEKIDRMFMNTITTGTMLRLPHPGFSLHILGHGVGNRLEQERFQHYGKTVSRYFGQVFDVVCRMAMDIIKPQDSNFRDIPEEILTESTYMPHFKDFIGVIDGTHILVSISPEDQIPYIGRKGIPTQNIMVCIFKIQLIFAATGWEGTAHDSRIFQKTIRDPALNFPKPLEC